MKKQKLSLAITAIALAVLLLGILMSNREIMAYAILVQAAGMLLAMPGAPCERAPGLYCVLALLAGGYPMLMAQDNALVLVGHTPTGDLLVPTGMGAYQAFACSLYAIIAGVFVGGSASESLLSGTEPKGRGTSPFLSCLCFLLGCACMVVPIYYPLNIDTRPFAFIALPALVILIASTRSVVFSALSVALYAASCYLGGSDLTIILLETACLSFFVACRCTGGIMCLAMAPALGVYLWKAGELTALSLNAMQPWWLVILFNRFNFGGIAVCGALAGALCYLLGRMGKSSFGCAAPVFAAMYTGGMYLTMQTLPSLPVAITAGVLYLLGLTFAPKPKKKKRPLPPL